MEGFSQMQLKCLVVGEMSLSRQCAERLLALGHLLVGFATSNVDLLRWAESNHIRSFDLNDLAQFEAFAAGEEFDYLFSIANGIVIPAKVLGFAKKASINFHDGPLPEMAGFFTTTHALLEQRLEHAITWHLMTTTIDAGHIVKDHRFPLNAEDTAFTLNARCFEAAIQSFEEMLAELASGTIPQRQQDLSKRNYYSRHKRPWCGCGIDFNHSSLQLEAFSRALNFGTYFNPFGTPVLIGTDFCAIAPVIQSGPASSELPGTVLSVRDASLSIAAGNGHAIVIPRVLSIDGFSAFDLDKAGIRAGYRFLPPEPGWAADATRLASDIARHEPFWVSALKDLQPLDWTSSSSSEAPLRTGEISVPAGVDPLAVIATYLSRVAAQDTFDLGFVVDLPKSQDLLFAPTVPLRVSTAGFSLLPDLGNSLASSVLKLQAAKTFSRSLPSRYPELRAKFENGVPHYPVLIAVGGEPGPLTETVQLHFQVSSDRTKLQWRCRGSEAEVHAQMQRLERMLLSAVTQERIADLPLLSAEETHQLLHDFNQTGGDFDRAATIHSLFEAQAKRTPAHPALSFDNVTITYEELNRRSDRLARHLKTIGVTPESIVGISMPRSIEMVTALFAVLKAGAAYLPLDPAYPESRIAFLLEDSQAEVLLVDGGTASIPPNPKLRIVDLTNPDLWADNISSLIALPSVDPAQLAYVIYTSGSTGKPKGVLVEHRNAVNFFAGMDRQIGTEPGTWLAVTSISFDISVLELFWTLSRGFHVVLAPENVSLESTPSASSARHLDFSLYYFGNITDASDPYRLLMEGARFADANGFTAVWTPERHFHSFGGLYPNPSVSSAALSGITKNVKLRAGSVVVPLHHPVRIAEEWALVDNLSQGRVGISVAPGWNERDFLFYPENYPKAKQMMLEAIDTVQALWRGEAVSFIDGKGASSEIRTYPRPVQKRLPMWVTAAGNPDTFRIAGASGCNLLTHLLGQTVEQLAAKIQIYRDARREAGYDPATGCVTLMLHTLVGEDTEEVRNAVRGPMKDYLLTSVDLIRKSPWSFPVFAKRGEGADFDLDSLSPEEMDSLLEHSFLRYFETSGLFGSVEQCMEIASRVSLAGADEIACLVDFGVPAERALAGLQSLNRLRKAYQQATSASSSSLPGLIEKYGVTHFQCTPSMATMIAATPEAAASLKVLRQMLVGGEALTPALAEKLISLISGKLHNMYGPTETTVWSAAHTFVEPDPIAPIGRPLLNTQIYLLDSERRLVPCGKTGELYIGGDGVTRGYLNRPELTAERFVPGTVCNTANRLYRTGDLARYRPDGTLEFLGRTDQQVKMRGYRIELMEIEASLAGHPNIREAAIIVREDTLLAFYTVKSAAADTGTKELRQWLAERLPPYMVPAAFVQLDRMPQTPNGKIDRKALPKNKVLAAKEQTFSAPRNETETIVANAFKNALGLEQLSVEDNFFDLGAHSLMIVQVRNQLQKQLPMPVPLLLFFQYPSVAALAAHLQNAGTSTVPAAAGERSKKRQEAMALRMGLRGRNQETRQ